MLRMLAFALVLMLQSGAKLVPPAAHIPATELDTALKDAIARKRVDVPVQTVDAGGHNVEVAMVYVAQPTGYVSHDKVTEMYYVIEGSGTYVSGGRLVNPTKADIAPTGVSQSGVSIEGGTTRTVGKGDYIVLPAGTPHAWTQIAAPLTYVDIRIDPEKILLPLGKRRLK